MQNVLFLIKIEHSESLFFLHTSYDSRDWKGFFSEIRIVVVALCAIEV